MQVFERSNATILRCPQTPQNSSFEDPDDSPLTSAGILREGGTVVVSELLLGLLVFLLRLRI
jgi:hypothetical protein